MTDPDDDLTIPADADLLAELRAEIRADETSVESAGTLAETWIDESDPTKNACPSLIGEPELIILPDEPKAPAREPQPSAPAWSAPVNELVEPAAGGPSTVAISKRRTRIFFAVVLGTLVVLVLLVAALILWATS